MTHICHLKKIFFIKIPTFSTSVSTGTQLLPIFHVYIKSDATLGSLQDDLRFTTDVFSSLIKMCLHSIPLCWTYWPFIILFISWFGTWAPTAGILIHHVRINCWHCGRIFIALSHVVLVCGFYWSGVFDSVSCIGFSRAVLSTLLLLPNRVSFTKFN